jgi:hypothetical protein
MSHPLAGCTVQTVDEVDLVAEKGRLCDCGRDDRNSFPVKKEDLHLGRRRIGRRNDLIDVPRNCLGDVHDGGWCSTLRLRSEVFLGFSDTVFDRVVTEQFLVI